MTGELIYLQGYPAQIVEKTQQLVKQNKLKAYLLSRYPECHDITNDKALYAYVQQLKNQYLKKSAPISKVIFDDKIHAIKNALGTHSYVSRIQGSKLKAKNEIRIARVFKKAPLPFLSMIVVHELAHVREKEHNKAFYKLCQHMEPDYFQLELDLRLYLTQLELQGAIY
ncbi:M48 family metallopeptidase [Psychrobium sp. 1_MG-2023]|uniref:M48 family metallopeptidase n=1 Tax=Psychrobium sp. 1_MG-2023 TaxID=3062624 RepID=UPI000C32DEC4|nr:M48 family metallopeptidase [Psychrobium sp. 1_MG-2023]MDP2562405.1 M48 family metallopeptidase [Psychrobium sp. 1_MG-2023]PKF56134.1 metal-dependent hydrolase [Alteromonadales bacterium alter-6D02]